MNGKWYDVNEFFRIYEKQHDKKYPLPKNVLLKPGKRKNLLKDLKDNKK